MSTNQTWRKSSRSSASNSCVELSAGPAPAIRDSKNPTGPTLAVALGSFLPAIKSGRFDRYF